MAHLDLYPYFGKMEKFIINGNSVSPFFNNHDLIFTEPLSNAIQLFDFLVYREGNRKIIKQCFGLPGNSISLNYPGLYFENKRCCNLSPGTKGTAQQYLWNSWINSCSGIIPKNNFFLLGTSLESIDSRQKGFIQFEDILGKPIKCPKM